MSTVPTVMHTQAIIVVILPLNFALNDIQTDMMIFLNTTTVDAPTLAACDDDCSAFNTDTGTKNALPMHCKHINPNNIAGVHVAESKISQITHIPKVIKVIVPILREVFVPNLRTTNL